MRRTWAFMLLRHEQPSAEAWEALERLARSEEFEPVLDFMWQIALDSQPAAERLQERLDELARTTGAVFHATSRDVPEPSDYERADFIELLGAELSTAPPFLLNEDQVLVPGDGAITVFDSIQTGPFVLDEARLDQPDADGNPPGPGGWDVILTAHGHKLVSQRLQDRLADRNVRGYELYEVIDARSGQPSQRMAQIVATKSVSEPVARDAVGDAEVISLHPGRGALLYLSRRAFKAISDLNGVVGSEILLFS